ncbi:MAG: RNA methyltransferase, partial [Hyphomicrobiales bacterium]
MMRGCVEGLGSKGDGLVRTADGLLHLPKVLPGEEIEIADGRLHKIVVASPERVEPLCAHYATCGGCKFQHWREDAYRAWKQARVAEVLGAAGLDTSVVKPMFDAHGAGRRRVSLHVRKQEGQWVAGFMEQKSHDLVALSACPVLVPALQRAPDIAARLGAVLGPCDVAVTLADNGLDV